MNQRLLTTIGTVTMMAAALAGQSVPKASYDYDFIGQPLADPVLQHDKETFVLFGCAYCHGLNLESRGEATDLLHSKLIGRDTDNKIIVALLKAGIPQTAKLSPMPQFSDLTDQQLNAIATWIHYARAQGRYRELTETKDAPPGTADAGKAIFGEKCAVCHSASGDLSGIGKRYGGATLKADFLKPKMMDLVPSSKVDQLNDQKKQTARTQHRLLLENYSPEEVSNIAAYLATLK